MILAAVPALNEEATIAGVLAGIPREIGGHPVEVLVVDDGSTDRTADIARAAGAYVISHGRNMGLGDTFRTMLGFAREGGYHFLATIDADGPFPPYRQGDLADAHALHGQVDDDFLRIGEPGEARHPVKRAGSVEPEAARGVLHTDPA